MPEGAQTIVDERCVRLDQGELGLGEFRGAHRGIAPGVTRARSPIFGSKC